jgi:hypothetical protein
MRRFFITGLPRSRTAWFAVASGAMHEPSARMAWSDLKAMWIGTPGMGVSDSGLAPRLPEILADVKPRTLIIERTKEAVLCSLAGYFGGLAVDWEKVNALLDEALRGLEMESPLIRRVAYRDLADMDTLMGCFDWIGVSPVNLDQLRHMNIQSDLGYNIAMLRRKAA